MNLLFASVAGQGHLRMACHACVAVPCETIHHKQAGWTTAVDQLVLTMLPALEVQHTMISRYILRASADSAGHCIKTS